MTSPHTVSWFWHGRRREIVVQLSPRVAQSVGRHLWRLCRLGLCGWQLEEGRWSSSYIPTRESPVSRKADSIHVRPAKATMDRYVAFVSGHPVPAGWEIAEELSTPPRHTEVDGRKALLLEGARTNLAIWSDGKPDEQRREESEWLEGDFEDSYSVDDKERHAVAALALYNQSFGFTREMVDALAMAVSTFENEYEGTSLHAGVAALAWSAVDNLRVLLPPENQ